MGRSCLHSTVTNAAARAISLCMLKKLTDRRAAETWERRSKPPTDQRGEEKGPGREKSGAQKYRNAPVDQATTVVVKARAFRGLPTTFPKHARARGKEGRGRAAEPQGWNREEREEGGR